MPRKTHNEDQDHTNEEPGLLGSSSDTSVTNDSNGESGGETGETDGETSSKLDESGVEGHGGGDCRANQSAVCARQIGGEATHWIRTQVPRRRDRRWQ